MSEKYAPEVGDFKKRVNGRQLSAACAEIVAQ